MPQKSEPNEDIVGDTDRGGGVPLYTNIKQNASGDEAEADADADDDDDDDEDDEDDDDDDIDAEDEEDAAEGNSLYSLRETDE